MSDDIIVRVGLDASGYTAGIEGIQRRTQSLEQSLQRMATTVSGAVSQGMNVMTRLDLVQITVQQSAERVTRAQEKYNEALVEFGSGSKQAIAANRELHDAQLNQEKAALRARASYVLVGAEFVTMATKAPQVIAGVQGIGAAALSTARNLTVMQAAGGAAVLALAGLVAFSTMFQEKVEYGTTAAEELALARKHLEENGKPISGGPILDFGREILANIDFLGTATNKYEKAVERLDKAQDAYAREEAANAMRRNAEAALKASQAIMELEAKQNALAASTRQGFQALGVDLGQFSQGFQEQMLLAAGVSQEFVNKLRPLVDVELMLKNAAGETAKALREQMTVTKRKDETTEDFIARLKELGFTEEEIAARINETRDALLSQADATVAAASVTSAASSGPLNPNPAGTRGAGKSGWEYNNTGGGPQQYMGLNGFISQNQQAVIEAFLGRKGVKTPPMDIDGVASALMSGSNGIGIPGVGFWVGDVGDERRSKMVNALKNTIVKLAPSTVWDSLLSQIGVNQFAHGVSGIVSHPGLFVAGEHGPESIEVRPIAAGQRDSGGKSVVFEAGSIVVHARDGEDAGEQIARRLRRLGISGY